MEKVVVGRDTERSEAETGCLSACLCGGWGGQEGGWVSGLIAQTNEPLN